MKKLLTFLLFNIISCFLVSQNVNYVNWSLKINNSNSDTIKVLVTANIKDKYFIYDFNSKLKDIEAIKFDMPCLFYTFKLNTTSIKVNDNIFNKGKINVLTGINEWQIKIPNRDKKISNTFLVVTYTVFSKDEFLQLKDTFEIKTEEFKENNNLVIPNFDVNKPLINNLEISNTINSKSTNWEIFILGILGGLIALLTPCVFPMIPLTISFFGKATRNKRESFFNALFYGLNIILIYFLLSIPFHIIDNFSPDFLNNIATNVYLNGIFFIIMIVFGISFLGVFEIQLPSKLINFADSKSNAKHLIGIFFMSLTLCIVSFSCTGPILGTLLVNTLNNSNGAMSLTIGLLGFGIGMGLPFSLLSLFPNLLKSLPKSGAWMGEFKKFLAFLEFALALKFFSNIDLVLHLGILKKEIMLGLWSLLMVTYSFYLFKIYLLIKKQKIILTKFRSIFGVIIFLFAIYLSIGVTRYTFNNAPQFYSWLSNGILPPNFYSIYAKEDICILNTICAKNYDEGLVLSKKYNRPILIDFTGWSCVNCRKMEENVWTNNEITKLLQEKFILVSLYVDDRTKLNESFFIKLNKQNKLIETVGDKWSYFQILNFKNNAQPFYAILNSDQQLKTQTIGYTPDIKAYKEWLLSGLK